MEKLINETIEIARKNFKGYGFEDAQVIPLLEAGRRDLTRELDKLHKLLEESALDIESINLSLHALKGLFLNMGNMTAADKLIELGQESTDARIISEIKSLLGM